MDVNEVLNIALPAVCVIVGITLVVLLAEIVKTLKETRTMLADVKAQVDPTLANVQQMTTDAVPAVAKIDPLLDRVQLTIDAVNLEMMRVDQILEDVTQISDSASSAVAAVDTVASAPVNLVSNVATKVRGRFKSKDASEETLKLQEQRVAIGKALEDYKNAEEQKEAEAEAEAEAASEFDAEELGYFTYKDTTEEPEVAAEPVAEPEPQALAAEPEAASEQPTAELEPVVAAEEPEATE